MYRSSTDEPASQSNMPVTQHGVLTIQHMLALLQPGALDTHAILGHRIRWAYSSSQRDSVEAKRVAEELKQRHLQMGAREVIVYRAGWLPDDAV